MYGNGPMTNGPLVLGDSWWANTTPTNTSWSVPAAWKNRCLIRLDQMIAKFGKKLAIARHESILHAREIVLEDLRRVRRLGAPILKAVVLVLRRGRVCGESNYYRAMLC